MITYKSTILALILSFCTVAIPARADILSRGFLYGSAALTAVVTAQYALKTKSSYGEYALSLKQPEKVRAIAINRFTDTVFNTLCFGVATGFFLYKAIKTN